VVRQTCDGKEERRRKIKKRLHLEFHNTTKKAAAAGNEETRPADTAKLHLFLGRKGLRGREKNTCELRGDLEYHLLRTQEGALPCKYILSEKGG